MADKILEKVDASRRSFLKRVLGAGFAVPVIATFSVEALSIDSAKAIDVSNATDNSNQFDRDAYLFNSFFFN